MKRLLASSILLSLFCCSCANHEWHHVDGGWILVRKPRPLRTALPHDYGEPGALENADNKDALRLHDFDEATRQSARKR